MKLLYMYFKYRDEFKRIFEDGIEFNFDSETRFKYEGNTLKKIDSVGVLPKGFFSVLPANRTSPVVDSVSVVAGGNGAGKTSIVEVLLDLKQETPQISKFERYIVVYLLRGNDDCLCDSNIPDLILPDGVTNSERENVFWPLAKTFQGIPLVYVTPHFTPYTLTEPLNYIESFSDLSTGGLMKTINEDYYNPRGADLRDIKFQDPIGAYQTEQTKWTLSFAHAKQTLPPEKKVSDEDVDDKLPRLKPMGIRISISKVVFQKLRSSQTSENVKSILQKIESSKGNFFENVFYAYAGLYVNDNNEAMSSVVIDKNNKVEQEAWNRFCEYRNDLMALFSGEEPPNEVSIIKFLDNGKTYQKDDHVDYVHMFFKHLQKLHELIPSGDFSNLMPVGSNDVSKVITEKHAPQYLAYVLELVDLHFKAKSIVPFLDFDTEPRMSSGERAFFDTWGRLYHHYKESVDMQNSTHGEGSFDISVPSTWPDEEDVIVFFDEAETTMHPDWQRRIVRESIWFFEAFAPWVHPHIIFATHSPILLSDIPAGNVILLERTKGENGADRSKVRTIEKAKAFASNIFDLYRDSFFFRTGGTIGAFAMSKVDALFKKLNERGAITDEQELDDVLQLAKLIDDPFISQVIWKRLDAFVEDDGDRNFIKQMEDEASEECT